MTSESKAVNLSILIVLFLISVTLAVQHNTPFTWSMAAVIAAIVFCAAYIVGRVRP